MSEYKALIFDFDGVILDSEEYKLAAFKSVFNAYPEHIDIIEGYNRQQRGVNRRVKFDYILKNILEVPSTPEAIALLTESYGGNLRRNFLELSLIPGVKEFLGSTAIPKFLASSGERDEIDLAMEHHGIRQHFDGISTHPVSKPDAIGNVLATLGLEPEQAVFFCDALADYRAAQATGVNFIAINEDPAIFPDGIRRVANFEGLTL
jgi:HAD superfamily hydrolase (TIGR01549 family)